MGLAHLELVDAQVELRTAPVEVVMVAMVALASVVLRPAGATRLGLRGSAVGVVALPMLQSLLASVVSVAQALAVPAVDLGERASVVAQVE